MKKLKSAFNSMLLGSNKSGTIRIKRFSNSKFSVKRFSDDGEEILDEEVVIDEEAPITEEIAESVPSDDIAVFSNSEDKTDEIVVAVDGGSTDEVVKEKTADDFAEDDSEPEVVSEETKTVNGPIEKPEQESK